jgi:EREBP-like factor
VPHTNACRSSHPPLRASVESATARQSLASSASRSVISAGGDSSGSDAAGASGGEAGAPGRCEPGAQQHAFRGITCAKHGTWKAQIEHSGRKFALGAYATPEEAARAFDAKALELRGPAAQLNFPSKAGISDGREVGASDRPGGGGVAVPSSGGSAMAGARGSGGARDGGGAHGGPGGGGGAGPSNGGGAMAGARGAGGSGRVVGALTSAGGGALGSGGPVTATIDMQRARRAAAVFAAGRITKQVGGWVGGWGKGLCWCFDGALIGCSDVGL